MCISSAFAQSTDTFRDIYDDTISLLDMKIFIGSQNEDIPQVNIPKLPLLRENYLRNLETLRRRLALLPKNDSTGILRDELQSLLNLKSIEVNECRTQEWSFVLEWTIPTYFSNIGYPDIWGANEADNPIEVENFLFIFQAIENMTELIKFYNHQAKEALRNFAIPAKGGIEAAIINLRWALDETELGHRLDRIAFKYKCPSCGYDLPKEDALAFIKAKLTPEVQIYNQTLNNLLSKAEETAYTIPRPMKEKCMIATMYNVAGMFLSPKDILKLGEKELSKTNLEMLNIMKSYLNNSNLTKSEMNVYLKSISSEQTTYTDSQEYLDLIDDAISRTESFSKSLTTKVTSYPKVVDVNYETDSFAETYWDCQINVNSKAPIQKYSIPSIMLHEGIPGHHLDLCKDGHGPDFPERQDKLKEFEHNTDRIEGWAFYTEELAYDLGFYNGALEKIGYLEWVRVRSLRLILTYKYFFEDWTIEEAKKFHRENTIVPETAINSETNRATHHTGQVLNYLIGRESIKEMREIAKKELGPKFDLIKFHDFILKNQNYSLIAIRGQLENFILENL